MKRENGLGGGDPAWANPSQSFISPGFRGITLAPLRELQLLLPVEMNLSDPKAVLANEASRRVTFALMRINLEKGLGLMKFARYQRIPL